MSETAEMIVEGILCQECGGVVDGVAVGYPRTCEECEEELF